MRSIKRDPEHLESEIDSEGSWAISYGDMITLLLCFFILFFTTDSQRDYRNRLTHAMLTVLNDTKFANSDKAPPLPILSIEEKPEKKSKKKSNKTKNEEQGIDEVLLKEWNGRAYQIGEKLLIEFPAVSFFSSGKTQLTREGEIVLAQFAQKYLPYSGQYIAHILAYTDRRKVIQMKKRGFRDNLELSALRAVASMRSLQRAGIPINRLRLGGHGELATTADELARLPADQRTGKDLDLARRVVIVIEPEGRFGL